MIQIITIARERVEDRFFDKVLMWPNGCWMWMGSVGGKMQYGYFWDGDKNVSAHRWAYKRYMGDIPEGKECHHICKNPKCVNPYHIKLVSLKEHAKTKKYKNPTHCHAGHEFSEENTRVRRRIVNGTVRNHRVCRECKRRNDSGFSNKNDSDRNTTSLH